MPVVQAQAALPCSMQDINDHFQQARFVCDGGRFQYEYYLRLEDMNEWYPCWEQGLALSKFTRQGWLTTEEGKKYDGVSKECWWKPPGISCGGYFAKATAANGTMQPVLEAIEAAEKHDEHDTQAAEKWREYYTQQMGDMLYEIYEQDFKLFGYEREVFEGTL